MSRIVLTLNTGGNWIHPKVFESHEDAARRWGAEYVQITEQSKDNPFTVKAQCLRDASAERVVWLDGDCIVRFDCPNLFDCVSLEVLAGVPNFQGDTHDADPWQYHETDWFWCCAHLSRYDLCYDPRTFLNSGVLVFSPRLHREIWADDFPPIPCTEQALMNFRAVMLEVPQKQLATTFNRIGPSAWESGPMGSFIQHLAAFSFANGYRERSQRQQAFDSIDWTKRAVREAVAA